MRSLLLYSLAFCFLSSCKKEYERASFISMGDETDMVYTQQFEFINGNYYQPEYQDIDIDGNGLMDLRLSKGMGNSGPSTPETRIESLHSSCKVMGRTVSDTTFRHETNLFSTDPSGNDVHIHSMTYSCEMESPNYVIDTVKTRFRPIGMLANKQISIHDEYLDVNMPLIELNTSSYEPTGVVNQGVTYYELTTHYKHCYTFPKEKYVYIGVKLYTPQGVKLGWVHLKLDSGSNILLRGWAIQL